MKIALVHDVLCGIGGSERVFQYICQAFPDADVYTFAYQPKKTFPYFSSREIRTTKWNRWITNHERFRWSFPFATYAMEALDLQDYDCVLTSSATVAKYVKTSPQRHICYCYMPTRALWHTDAYFELGWKKKCIAPFLSWLKHRDYVAAQRVSQFIAISQTSQQYIQEYYDKEAWVLPCPIETEKFSPGGEKGDHYLLVSRLEKWKQVEYAVRACTNMGKKLRIVGDGQEKGYLKSIAGPSITFLGGISDEQLLEEYRRAKGVIFTPELEYGLIPLEANACGTPVLCYGKGGVLETMTPATAVFFYEQTAKALEEAIERFERLFFEESVLVEHAAQWGISTFQEKLRQMVIYFMGQTCGKK